jgi:hypothetical protein
MTSKSLKDQIAFLDRCLPLLELLRGSSAFANDVYEGAVYWRNLGKRALENDTRVNYSKVARQEKDILARLAAKLSEQVEKTGFDEYANVLATAERLLDQVAAIPPGKDGHLGFLTEVKREFTFLRDNYGFQIRSQRPTCIRYSSGAVYVEFDVPGNPVLSCQFGPDNGDRAPYWMDDLLYLHDDPRYRMIPRRISALHTRDEVRRWVTFFGDIWRQYGDEVLKNSPGVFERLAAAQKMRDKECEGAGDEGP